MAERQQLSELMPSLYVKAHTLTRAHYLSIYFDTLPFASNGVKGFEAESLSERLEALFADFFVASVHGDFSEQEFMKQNKSFFKETFILDYSFRGEFHLLEWKLKSGTLTEEYFKRDGSFGRTGYIIAKISDPYCIFMLHFHEGTGWETTDFEPKYNAINKIEEELKYKVAMNK